MKKPTVTFEMRQLNGLDEKARRNVLQYINMTHAGMKQVPLDVQVTDEHKIATAKALAVQSISVTVVANEDGSYAPQTLTMCDKRY